MSNCILCSKTGKDRKYFFKGKPLCDEHSNGYLEYLIDGLVDEVTAESKNDAFEKYKIKLEPKPAPIKPMPKPKPTPYSSNPFKMGM